MNFFPVVNFSTLDCFKKLLDFLGRNNLTTNIFPFGIKRKLADFLLSEFTTDSGTPEVTVKSCAELATRLNLSRASLYRAFGQLEQSGMITRSGKTIVLTDVSALQNV